ncbi:hypothetical protein SSCH_1150005 [Syntrophaceticus schinkii]|uniref:Uncharacterized protein n=2 Tax=Syntrophaceticus schinkii TaxID=499207 RepID=A0A0B7MH88_9FIRM|nr:hypothetical protein SSCH_1150005 [Syntrophaceticus schinkii]
MAMSVRRYVAVRTVGNPEQILNKIKNAILRLELANTIPVIKIEKNASREFYVFLAVDGYNSDVLPEMTNRVFSIAGIKGEKLWPLSIK